MLDRSRQGERSRSVVDRTQRRTFAHELHRPAPLTTKRAEWQSKWNAQEKGGQHPTPYEAMARSGTLPVPGGGVGGGLEPGRSMEPADRRASPSPALLRRSPSPTRESFGSFGGFGGTRESFGGAEANPGASRPTNSTINQLSDTGYLFGEPGTLTSSSGRLSLTLTGADGQPVLPSTPLSPLRSGALRGSTRQIDRDGREIERATPAPTGKTSATPLITRDKLTVATHGHLNLDRKVEEGPWQDRYRRVSDYVRPHPFEPNRAKVWAPPTESPPAWPYQERVRGGRSPSPQKTRTEASPFALADHGRPVTSNQIYGASVEPSPHDAARGDAKEARGSIDQHKTAFFGPMNWRTDAGSKLTGDPKVYHHVGGN